MELVDNFLKVIMNYVGFSGRARRREFWLFCVANIVISAALGILSLIPFLGILFYIVTVLFSLAILLPSLALAVRRLHDIGKDWPWLFIAFIPLIGEIWLIILMATPGTAGHNAFGPDPKQMG